MALTNASLSLINSQPSHDPKQSTGVQQNGIGRRRALTLLATAGIAPEVNGSRKALLQEYLKRSKENKEKNDKERLDDYYKRNYKDYFEFIEGSLRNKQEDQLSESDKGILEWLKKNKKSD